jgi:phosphopantetheine--protein transferase-like protein
MLEDRPFLEKIFTEAELEYCLGKADPKKHLAARFCAKEAVIKALAQHKIDATVEDIEVMKDALGLPRIKVNLETVKDLVIQVSLSHCDSIAVAQAVIYSKKDHSP